MRNVTFENLLGIIVTKMKNFSKKLLLILFALSGLWLLIQKPAFAQERFQGVIIDAEDPAIYTEGDQRIYTQRVLVRIETGAYKGLEEETVHSYPTPGMTKPLSIGDNVIVEVNTENISEPIVIVDYSRSNYLAILAVVAIVGTAIMFASKKADWAYVLAVILAPLLTFVVAKYAGLPPVIASGLSAVLLGTAALAIHYTKSVPIITAIVSFLVSYLIGGAAIYGISVTLNVYGGIIEPFISYYGVSYPDRLEWYTMAGLLLIPFAAILSIVNSTLGGVIKRRAADEKVSKSVLVKEGVSEGLSASKDAVFSFLLVSMGFLLPIFFSLTEQISIKDVVNLEFFSYLFMLGITPILMCIISAVSSGAISGVLLGSTMPHRLISDREAPDLLTPKPEAPILLSKKRKSSELKTSQSSKKLEKTEEPIVVKSDREWI